MVLSMTKWIGKVAVVTGASSGIGAAIAEQLVENGMKVIGLARRVELVEEHAKKLTGKKGELHGLKIDMRITQEILDVFQIIEQKFGPIHILVNTAGIIRNTSLSEGDIEEWKETFDTNVIALCVATKVAIASMKKNIVDGHIIHMNGLAGHRIPQGIELNAYPASKFAVTALTETLRRELVQAGSKIKVTSISPGLVQTDILNKAGWNMPLDVLPTLKPNDIADAAIYVLSTPSHVQVHELSINPVGEVS